ncbi:MAG: PQQ-binding-like beta-propeller repeat protein [Candidatus Aenigmarchaeota archaeon]|nr:PQQ-binding-like beta-propeller repeat protein [Candidatus Aenigmarchaeota archaeon]
MEEADFSLNPRIIDTPYRYHTISMGGSILSSPCAEEGTIFFGCNDTYVYAIDEDGDKQWSFKTGGCIFSSPTVYKNSVFVGSNDGHLYCFDKSGELLWKFFAGSKVMATPLVVGDTVYIGSESGVFYAIDTSNGKELWRFFQGDGLLFMSPSCVNDSIITGNLKGGIFCISSDGRLIWKKVTGDHSCQSPLLVDKNNFEISSFRKRSCDRMPKADNPRMFMGGGTSFFRCMNTKNGDVEWKFFANRMGSSSAAIAGGRIFFGSYDGKLYCVDTKGNLVWSFQTGNRIVSSPLYDSGIVYVGSSDNNVYAIDAKEGKLIWRFLTNGEVVSSPAIAKDILYAGSWDCNLYAIDVKTRELLWKFRTSLPVPSFIKKPTMTGEEVKKMGDMEFVQPTTVRGIDAEKQYSVSAGELTSSFYASPVKYKSTPGYKDEMEKYRR